MPRRPDPLRLRALALVCAALVTACAGLQPPPVAPRPAEIPELRSEVERNPRAVDVRVRLGAAYREADRLEEAREVLREARRRDPDHARAAYFLGLTLEDLRRYGEARAVYREFLETSTEPYLRRRIERRIAHVDRRALEASVERSLAREQELADRPPAENTLAVFPFLYRGAAPRFEPLARALTAFLVTDLSRSDRITILERMRVQLLLQEMELSESRFVDPSTAVRSGRMLGSARVVQGLLRGSEPTLEVEATVVGTRESPPETLEPAFADERAPDRLLGLEAEIALAVFRSLGVELTPAERQRIRGRPTDDLEAMLAFGRGLMAEDTANFSDAALHYRRASRLDPDFEAAGERADRASDLSTAAAEATDELTRAAFRERMDEVQLDDLRRGTGNLWREGLPTGPLIRDPMSELLGTEGVSGNTGIIRIRIPPPGGGDGR